MTHTPSVALAATFTARPVAEPLRFWLEELGLPARVEIRYRRLIHAAELLRSDRQIAEVALSCGFYDQSHFCRAFRSHFGAAPAVWRASLAVEWS